MKEIDEEFQPNLELRTWLDKVLPEGMAYDPNAADLMQTSEFDKGLKINAINAHNARIATNRAIAKTALGIAAVGGASVGGGVLGGAIKQAAQQHCLRLKTNLFTFATGFNWADDRKQQYVA